MPRTLTPARLVEEQWVTIEDAYIKVLEDLAKAEVDRRSKADGRPAQLGGHIEIAPDGAVKTPRGWPRTWSPQSVEVCVYWRGRRRSTRPVLFVISPDGARLGLSGLQRSLETVVSRLPAPYVGRVYLQLRVSGRCVWHRSWSVDLRLPTSQESAQAPVPSPMDMLNDLCRHHGFQVPSGTSGRATAPTRPRGRSAPRRADDEDRS